MNIAHLKYAVEVAKTGSVTKAAQNLFMGQPNLSKALRELEESFGITIFKRNSKGIVPTQKGEEFLAHARRIIAQVDELEAIYRSPAEEKQKLSISIPRGSYMTYGFADFIKKLDAEKAMEIYYCETNSIDAVKNILEANYNLGIIRYRDVFEPYFSKFLREKGLRIQPIWEFEYQIVISKEHKLANKKIIKCEDLSDFVEILHCDNAVPYLPAAEAKQMDKPDSTNKHIHVFEQGSKFELLSRVKNTFMWDSPMPSKLLSAYGLVERKVSDADYRCKDVLVCLNNYKLTKLDQMYIDELYRVVKVIEKQNKEQILV